MKRSTRGKGGKGREKGAVSLWRGANLERNLRRSLTRIRIETGKSKDDFKGGSAASSGASTAARCGRVTVLHWPRPFRHRVARELAGMAFPFGRQALGSRYIHYIYGQVLYM